MHELLAPLLYAVDYDAIDSPDSPATNDDFNELCSATHIQSDAYTLFTTLMSSIGHWYEWREPPLPPAGPGYNVTLGQVEMSPYVAPIVSTCHQVQDGDMYLKRCDPALRSALVKVGVEPQIWGM